MGTPYVSSSDVSVEQGSLGLLWPTLDPAAQAMYLDAVSREIDRLVPQEGGLWQQTKTKVLRSQYETDSVILPNRPVTAISSLLIRPWGSTTDTIVTITADNIELSGGQSFRYIPGDDATGGQINFRPIPFLEGDRITVTYTCGIPLPDINNPAPGNLRKAGLLILSTLLFSATDNPAGAQRARQGQSQLEFGTTALLDRNLWLAAQLLDPYRLTV